MCTLVLSEMKSVEWHPNGTRTPSSFGCKGEVELKGAFRGICSLCLLSISVRADQRKVVVDCQNH